MRKLQAFKQYYDKNPISKQRARMPRNGGRTYTPKRTVDFENAVREGWTGPKLDGKLYGIVSLAKDHFTVELGQLPDDQERRPLRGDVDNYAKSILDGLNGVAFSDDRQVHVLVVVFDDAWGGEFALAASEALRSA